MKKLFHIVFFLSALIYSQDYTDVVEAYHDSQKLYYDNMKEILKSKVSSREEAILLYNGLANELSQYEANEEYGKKLSEDQHLSTKIKEQLNSYFAPQDDIVGEINAVILNLNTKYQLDFFEFYEASIRASLVYYIDKAKGEADGMQETLENTTLKKDDKKINAVIGWALIESLLKRINEMQKLNEFEKFKKSSMLEAVDKAKVTYQKIMKL